MSDQATWRPGLSRSIVVRLLAAIIFSGAALSLLLGRMQYERTVSVLRIELSQRANESWRNMLYSVRQALRDPQSPALSTALTFSLAGKDIRAVRLAGEGHKSIDIGDWPDDPHAMVIWDPTGYGLDHAEPIRLDKLSLIQTTLWVSGKAYRVAMVVDGPAARRALDHQLTRDLTAHGLFIAIMMLLALLLLRRWVTEPLQETLDLIESGSAAEPYARLARRHRTEMGQLAHAVGEMLRRLQITTTQLRQREQAFESLYQFAPVAMLSVDREGRVLEANHRAADLLHLESEAELIGRSMLDFTHPADRARLTQAIVRLESDAAPSAEIRLLVAGRTLAVSVECAGVRDDQGDLHTVRVSMVDVTASTRLRKQLVEKSQVLNLIIDHMSDGILLIDGAGQVAACNERLCELLHTRPDVLAGKKYDPATFWREMSLLDPDAAVACLTHAQREPDRHTKERFEARTGVFNFEGVPVSDPSGHGLGRLWVVRDISSQEQNKRLLSEQTRQMQALRQVTRELCGARGVDDLIARVAVQMQAILGVEAVGLALRVDEDGRRSRQVVHRGDAPLRLDANRLLIETIEHTLMPMAMSNERVTAWLDLPRTPWARSLSQAGLTCFAAAPLIARSDPEGVIWIARRGGERLERSQVYLLEIIAPVVAARLEAAQLVEHLHNLELTDPVTDLPNESQFRDRIAQCLNRPGEQFALLRIKLDQFSRVNERLEHEAADEVLRQVATLLRRSNRRSCMVARLRGPAFAILAPGLDVREGAAMAERMRGLIAALTPALAGDTRLTASIGVAGCPDDGHRLDALLTTLEQRVEQARRLGRDRVVAHHVISEAG